MSAEVGLDPNLLTDAALGVGRRAARDSGRAPDAAGAAAVQAAGARPDPGVWGDPIIAGLLRQAETAAERARMAAAVRATAATVRANRAERAPDEPRLLEGRMHAERLAATVARLRAGGVLMPSGDVLAWLDDLRMMLEEVAA